MTLQLNGHRLRNCHDLFNIDERQRSAFHAEGLKIENNESEKLSLSMFAEDENKCKKFELKH